MKTKFLIISSFLITLFVSSENVLAARKIATVHGILGTLANGKSLLITSGDKGYYFDPASMAGSKILSTCQTGKDCIVRGVINDKVILSAYYVKVGK